MTVIVRGFLGRRKRFEETLRDVAEADVAALAERHVAELAQGAWDMVELEFPEEPDPLQRYYRMGTNPARMVKPIRIDL